MSTTKSKKTSEQPTNVDEILSKSEQFIEKNQQKLLMGIGVVVLLVVAFLGIRHLYLLPKEKEAAAAMFKGEAYFANNQWDLALNGDSLDYIGFEKIAKEYSITKSGELAKVYAGICYYHKGDPQKAIEFLNGFSAGDRMISPAITGLVGDCYVDMGEVSKSVRFFEKAASKADNELISPIYLKKVGLAYESLGENSKALKAYTALREKYPNAAEATSIERYIERVKNK